MTGNELRTVADFETNLAVGTPVRVRWTNSGYYFNAVGKIAKINAKSVRVTLDHDVPGHSGGYKAGREILAPKLLNLRDWSCNNRVEPVDGYKPV